MMTQDTMKTAAEKVQGALSSFGLQDAPTRIVRTHKSGIRETRSLKWAEKESSIGFDELRASVELYTEDSYPDDNGWIFFHVWNCIGGSSRGRDLVDHLRRNNIECRSTTRNKYRGIAVKINPGEQS